MIKLIIPSLLLVFLSSLGNAVLSQNDQRNRINGGVIQSAVPFLTIAPDARSGAMGDAGVAISSDANASHWNPSKLAFADSDYGASLSYTPWLGQIINDMFIFYASGYYKISSRQAVSLSMRYFDLGEIVFTEDGSSPGTLFNPREFAFQGAYSQKLTENLSISGSLKYIRSNLTGNFSSSSIDAQPGSSVAVGVGLYYFKELMKSGNNSSIAFGMNISDVGGKISYASDDVEDFIPGNLRLGGAYTTDLDPYNSLTFALDFNKLLVPTPPILAFDDQGNPIDNDNDGRTDILEGKDPDRGLLSGTFGSFTDAPDGFSEELQEVTISAGVEYWYNKLFAARVGYFHEATDKGNRKYFTTGVGFRYQKFGIDFAYLIPTRQNHPLAETLRFTLHFTADRKEKSDSPNAE